MSDTNEQKMDELLRLMRSAVPDPEDMNDAGRVGFVYKYDYDPAESYEKLDVVLYGPSLWTPKQNTTGNAPPDQSQAGQESVRENEFWNIYLPGALGADYIKKTDIAKPPTETEPGSLGVVMPDGKTIQIDEDGLLTGTPVDFVGTWKDLQEGIASGEIANGMVGYIEGSEDNGEDPDHPNNLLFDIDDFLSTVSSNAVQNRIITAALNRIEALENETRELRASMETFGLSKIAPINLTDVTENNGMVLGAAEKNASIEGTLGNSVENIKNAVFQGNSGKFVIPGGLRLCWGHIPFGGALDVTFPIEFTQQPFVFATSNYDVDVKIVDVVRIINITKEGFKFLFIYKDNFNSTDWNIHRINTGVNWIALGY